MDIICILWKYPRSVDIILILWIYMYSVDIIRILWKYSRPVDIIYIDHIMSYLACNVRPIFHIYYFSEIDWCITSFPVCLLMIFSSSYFCLVFLGVIIN